MSTKWQPLEDLLKKDFNYAVIILNTPISEELPKSFLINLWNNAKVRLTIDGGTKRWFNWINSNPTASKPIDLITGDFDSLSTDILNHFEKQYPQIQVIHTPDQDETDFVKGLKELKNYCDSNNICLNSIFVLSDTFGRFDQIMANINALFKSPMIFNNVQVILIASRCLTWLLQPGKHDISIPQTLKDAQEWCSLIPIGSSCYVTTSGLKWNLNHGKLEFGGMVSTSNTYESGASTNVKIETDKAVIWSMGVYHCFKNNY